MWMYKNVFHCNFSIFQIICAYLVILLMMVQHKTEGCGSYISLGTGKKTTITTGSNYAPNLHCLWWIETSSGSQLSINLTYVGNYNVKRCGDYIVIWDGTTTVMDQSTDAGNCTTLTNSVHTATSSWLRVQFYSDGVISTSGFTGTISSTYVGSSITNYSSPIIGCKSFEMECSNKVCMTLSYRCDGFNDCGCDDDCDESGCDGLPIGKYTIMLIGGLTGLGLFVGFFIFAYCYESYLRRKTLQSDPEAQAELQKKKAAQKRKEAKQKAAKQKKGHR